MAFVPFANTAQVEVVWEVDSQIVENVLHFDNPSPGSTNLAALLEAMNAAIQDQVLPLLHSGIQLLRLIGTLLDVAEGLQIFNTTGFPTPGTNSGSAMPNNVAACLSLKSTQRGRSARGRSYIAGIPHEALIAPSEINPTYQAALVDAWQTVLLAGVDDGWVPVVASRVSGGVPRTTGVTFQIETVTMFDATLDSQRRRLPGRGT